MSLDFSTEQLTFTYQLKGHLNSSITLINHSQTKYYFKFKLTRPKYYLIKPDRGFIQPKKTLKVQFTLHEDGVQEGQTDKLRCFFIQSASQPVQNWDKNTVGVMSNKFCVTINGLPDQYKRKEDNAKNSELKSLAHSKFQSGSFDNLKKQQVKVAHLRSSIQNLKKGDIMMNGNRSGWMGYVLISGVGLLIGVLTSIWI